MNRAYATSPAAKVRLARWVTRGTGGRWHVVQNMNRTFCGLRIPWHIAGIDDGDKAASSDCSRCRRTLGLPPQD